MFDKRVTTHRLTAAAVQRGRPSRCEDDDNVCDFDEDGNLVILMMILMMIMVLMMPLIKIVI